MTGPGTSREDLTRLNVVNLGPALATAARSHGDLDCLEVFSDLVALDSDGARPHLRMVMLEPSGSAQVVMIGHASPGLTIQVDDNQEFALLQLWFEENRVLRRSDRDWKPGE